MDIVLGFWDHGCWMKNFGIEQRVEFNLQELRLVLIDSEV
jgi:hypothetical protein